MEDTGAKQHSYYCTHRQHVTIGKRAKAAGMNRSRFMMACALHGDAGGGERLVLGEKEQRILFDRVAELEHFMEAHRTDIPGLGMSLPDAIAFLVRVEKEGTPADEPPRASEQVFAHLPGR